MQPMSIDKEKVHFNTVKIKKGGENFEMAVDPDLAIAYRNKKPVDIMDIVKSTHVFADVKKGLLASEEHMKTVFGTKDSLKVAEILLKEGELQLTKEYRQQVFDEKRKKVLNIIQRNGVDPKTLLPHPMVRIENAFEEANIKIDFNKSPEDQVQDILKLLRPVLPIKFEIIKVEVKIGAKYAAKMYGTVASFGKIQHDAWLPDGTWEVVVEMPAGLQNDFYEKLNALTHGDVSTKIIK